MFIRFSLLIFLSAFLFISCSTEHANIVVGEFTDSQITMAEFEKAYTKNAGSLEKAENDSYDDYKNFAELYINFKMKLRDARIRGYNQDESLKDELDEYKRKVGASYILEKDLVEPALKKIYDQRKTEVRASHLMLRPTPERDEAQSKELANTLLDSIKNGLATFEELVQRHSDDQFSKPKDGDIFYFTAAQLPVEFEQAAYNTPVGEVYPEVVQTRFGSHIIKVTDRKERIPKISASHILAGYTNENGEVDSAAALEKINSVMQKLKDGEDFAELAKQYSDDTGTKDNGGDLGFFERRMMVQEFDEVAFNLNVGEISDIVQTNFGYHIIKLNEIGENPSFEEDKENIRNIYKRLRYQDDYNALISSLREKYNYQINKTTIERIIGYADSTKIGSEYPHMAEIENEIVFACANSEYNFSRFYGKLKEDPANVGKLFTTDLLTNAADKISEEILLEAEALTLDEVNPEFAELMDDYKNGIFIFKLQEEEVWNKVQLDSIKLKEFYEVNKEKYVFPDRVTYTELFVRSKDAAEGYYDEIKNGTDFDSLVVNFTERSGLKERKGRYELQAVGSSEFSTAVNELKAGEFTEPISNSGGFSILRLDEKQPSRIKTFDEARAEVSGAFQEAESKRLEQEYIQRLKTTYKPVIHYSELHNAFKPESN
ncbi:MAG: peptidylprolyl isomerase [Ignavibacteriaceae bacterium]